MSNYQKPICPYCGTKYPIGGRNVDAPSEQRTQIRCTNRNCNRLYKVIYGKGLMRTEPN